MNEAAVLAEPTARRSRARRPLSLDLLIALTAAGTASLAIAGIWIELDGALQRGFHFRTGLAAAGLAASGFVLVIFLRTSRNRLVLQTLSLVETVVALAAIALVTFEIVHPRPYDTYCRPRAGAWSTLGFAIAWASFSLLRSIASLRTAIERDPPAPGRTRVTPALVGALLATFFLMVGAFGPWSDAASGSLSGLSGSYRGWIALVGAIMSTVALLTYVALGRKSILFATSAAAVLSFAAAAADRSNIDGNSYLIAGWGITVTLAASVALLLATLVIGVFREPSLLRAPKAELAGEPQLVRPSGVPSEKICPDCAETVKTAARVCRFCGFRFDASAPFG